MRRFGEDGGCIPEFEGRRLGTGEGTGDTGRRLGEGGARMPCVESVRRARGRIDLNASEEKMPNTDLNRDPRGWVVKVVLGWRIEGFGVLGTLAAPKCHS